MNSGPRCLHVFGLAAKAKYALDVAGQTALALCLHLVVQRWEGHMVEGEVEEQRLTGDRLELGGELDQTGMLSNQGLVQVEVFQAFTQRLRRSSEKQPITA